MPSDHSDPLFGAAPSEIPLPSAPLVNVLCQVRFTEVLSIQRAAFVAGFQERVRSEYPFMQHEKMKTISIDENGESVAMGDDSVWRFVDTTKTWRLSLTPSFITLETRKYTSRIDFVDRVDAILIALAETINPTHVVRIGIRYVDRINLEEYPDMREMIRPEMLGILAGTLRDGIHHSLSEVILRVKEGHLLARWGLMPPKGTHDPESMPPISAPSWFLDLDTFADFQASPAEFNSAKIRESVVGLATRAYTFFRWVVEEPFIAAFGGEAK